ncbi:Mitochondrial ribosome small subunit biogenesis protein [Elasticomyces elasticus]|nr:Mitochondrial ribosome small subunit biogenesis protein [Elasticomyces elasticus]
MKTATRNITRSTQWSAFTEPSLPRGYLWPSLLRHVSCRQSLFVRKPGEPQAFSSIQRHRDGLVAAENPAPEHLPTGTPTARQLPLSCPGCGAPSQTVAPDEAGYYSKTRSAVRVFLSDRVRAEDAVFNTAVSQASDGTLAHLGLIGKAAGAEQDIEPQVPICDRCHNLVHHHVGVPIFHPSIKSIEDIIAESPHMHNHIYHVLDAADFPMSLIPNLQHALKLPRQRTQNRRSKSQVHGRGRIAEVTFIITRSDLLAPKKEQVDRLMPYLQEVLREALGRTGRNVRLGNVRCVSSKRGWWTKEVKEAIWTRGGAGWMVGKVNVGKSNLFEVVFPKGRNQDVNFDKLRHAAGQQESYSSDPTTVQFSSAFGSSDLPGGFDVGEQLASEDMRKSEAETLDTEKPEDHMFDEDEDASLLPPAQLETAYPVMPTISSLPGTTASPIRVPFGNGRGELIDLPGLARTTLDTYVQPEHKSDLVMRSRVTPVQQVINPGQSLLLGGGLIRITPTTPDLVFLAYAFTPLQSHVTSTIKALAMQTGERAVNVPSVAEESAREKMISAGTFELSWDVTKQRAGPLISPSVTKFRVANLPFVVYAADILVEGVGWIEIVAQMRSKPRKDLSSDMGELENLESSNAHKQYPKIEVFSPEGKFIGIRKPMNAWLLGGKQAVPVHKRKARPRRSMASMKGRNG